jgi:capsular polysaccharide export protein
MHDNATILLFAFRKSHKGFFETVVKESRSPKSFKVLSTREIIWPSCSGLSDLKNVDFKPACDFATKELFAKTNLKFPKFLIYMYFNILAYITYFRYYKVLSKGYTKMLLWNGGKFRQLIAIEIAQLKGIHVYYYENGLLPKKVVLDPKGINFNNSVPRERKFYENYVNDKELPSELVPRATRHVDKFDTDKATELPKEYIFVPFQVDYDTQIIKNSPWISNMRELFGVIENISKNTKYNFVLKEHPSSGVNYPDLHKKVVNIPNITFQNGHSTQELIEKSLAVITVNSTVGTESLLFHKKVIVLGNAFYTIDGISHYAKSIEELSMLIDKLDKLELNEDLIDNFLRYLNYDYLISNDDDICRKFAEYLLKD